MAQFAIGDRNGWTFFEKEAWVSRLRVLERDMGTGRNGKGHRRGGAAEMQELLHRMEAELRLLQGMVVLLRALSETTDSVEPVAFEVLARLMDEPMERIMACWREAFDATRGC